MVNKHTPGPWTIRSKYNVFGQRADGDIVSLVATTGGHQSNTYEVNPENEANARLIAAAPDLLSVLKVTLEYFNAPPELQAKWATNFNAADMPELLSKAIKKAEGA